MLAVAGLVAAAWWYRVAHMEQVHAAQRMFSRQLIASQETERKRIAAELHDSLGQRLIVIKNLALLHMKGTEGAGTNVRVEEISAEVSNAIREVKEISYDLRPYQLDRIGLTRAVDSLVQTAGGASRIDISAVVDNIDDVFPAELQIHFYRVVQEALTNMIKHSAATQGKVMVCRSADQLLLTISDNGHGRIGGGIRGNDSTDQHSGFGLTGMRERGQSLGGVTSISFRPGQGTMVRLDIRFREAS